MKVKFLNAAQAVDLIHDNDCIATSGFVTIGIPEEIETALEEKFLKTGNPAGLTLYYAAGQGDGKGCAVDHLAHPGLLRRVIGGHWNLAPKLQKLAMDNEVEAYNFPQGIISHMFRDAASGKPYTISKVGLYTFVDPDVDGGKLNTGTQEDLVHRVMFGDEHYLAYDTPKIDVAILRGTYADEMGNVTLEEEGATLETTSIALAAKSNGGKVIVQVKDIVEAGSLDPKLVKLSNTMVDVIVKTSDIQKYHQQTVGTDFLPWFTGQKKAVLAASAPLPLNNRKIIGRRCALEMQADQTVNLGIGIPEAVASVLNEEGQGDKMTLTVESGLHGGVPGSGPYFGESFNPYMILDQDRQFDFYDGGGLDITFLGLAQCDPYGNINVSKFGPRIAGCGGFINISQNTKKVVFCGTFTAGGLKETVEDGRIRILQEGSSRKFVKQVEQCTFSSVYATEAGQEVLYITERCVFRLIDGKLVLTEYAPGIDIEKDILGQMDFKPEIDPHIRPMDIRIFLDEKMGLSL